MAEILLLEDDPVIGRGLQVSLELESYRVQWAKDVASALALITKKTFDLMILDLNLPDGSGLSVLEKVRSEKKPVPVIILTAKTDEDSVVMGLESGANDYIRKPFGARELLARIRIALQEPSNRGDQIRYGDLVIQIDKRKLLFSEKQIELNRREFEILLYFMQHAESAVPREALISAIDSGSEIYDRTIDSHVSHLRSRLRQAGVESVRIASIYGVGYRLEKA